MRIRITRIDDRPTYLPLPETGALEVKGELKPTYEWLADNRIYAEVHEGEFSVIIDGTVDELEAVTQHYRKEKEKNVR